MQRRAAALYAAFFLVVALGSYGVTAVASQPSISIDDPDHTVTNGSQLTVGDRTYDATVEGGSATLTWTNQSATHTATWENESTVALGGTNFTAVMAAQANPPQVQLTEEQPLGENVTTTEVNGTQYVVLGEGPNRQLVAVDEYRRQQFGPPETRTFAVGDSVQYQGNSTTVVEVTNESATLEWTAPRTESVDAAEGEVVTLADGEYVAHFRDGQTLVLDRNVQAYQDQVAVQERYQERMNGLWGVTVLSALTVVGLLALAYLPSRY